MYLFLIYKFCKFKIVKVLQLCNLIFLFNKRLPMKNLKLYKKYFYDEYFCLFLLYKIVVVKFKFLVNA